MKFDSTISSSIPICYEPRREPEEGAVVRPEVRYLGKLSKCYVHILKVVNILQQAMYVYGLDDASTGDIKAAFSKFQPSHIEWINLSSVCIKVISLYIDSIEIILISFPTRRPMSYGTIDFPAQGPCGP